MEDRTLLTSIMVAFLFLLVSLLINFFAGTYATIRASYPVTDIFLSNIRAYDVDGFFVYGPLVLWSFVVIYLLFNPKQISFTMKSIALFIVIRSIFVTLTHIGPFPTQITINANSFFDKFTFGGDLFFSGHTGFPFLLALIYWNDKVLRYLFITSAIFFGFIVLLGHLHYSIDVLSAFFITYSIFHIAEYFFKRDRKVFLSSCTKSTI